MRDRGIALRVELVPQPFLDQIRYRLPMGVVEALNSRLEVLIYRARGAISV